MEGLIASIFTPLIVVVSVLVLVACCIVPCTRGLIQRLIETALTKQLGPPPHQANILLMDTLEHESQTMLRQFKKKEYWIKNKRAELWKVTYVFSIKGNLGYSILLQFQLK